MNNQLNRYEKVTQCFFCIVFIMLISLSLGMLLGCSSDYDSTDKQKIKDYQNEYGYYQMNSEEDIRKLSNNIFEKEISTYVVYVYIVPYGRRREGSLDDLSSNTRYYVTNIDIENNYKTIVSMVNEGKSAYLELYYYFDNNKNDNNKNIETVEIYRWD